MRRISIALTFFLLAAAPACAREVRTPWAGQPTFATVLVNPVGQPIGGIWQRWVDEAKVATGGGTLVLDLTAYPSPGCSVEGPMAGGACSAPGVTYMQPGQPLAVDRADLYFELGHQFDWRDLTGSERHYLSARWRMKGAPWNDSLASLDRGTEDGLEATFAAIYADCAWGQNDDDAAIGMPGQSRDAEPSINTCAYIDQIARAHASRGR